MKNFIFKTMLWPISLLAACSNKSQTIEFIPGTYVNQAKSQFSIANDTLLISPVENTPNSYLIIRNTGFRRIEMGQMLPLEQKVRNFNGTWDEQQQTLQIMQNGSVIIFQPKQNRLLIQNSTYRKL